MSPTPIAVTPASSSIGPAASRSSNLTDEQVEPERSEKKPRRRHVSLDLESIFAPSAPAATSAGANVPEKVEKKEPEKKDPERKDDDPATKRRPRRRRSADETSSVEGEVLPGSSSAIGVDFAALAYGAQATGIPKAGRVTQRVGVKRIRWIEKLWKTSEAILAAAKDVKVLPSLEWEPEVKEEFFQKGEKEPPRPTYSVDKEELEKTATVFREIALGVPGDNEIERWLRAQCESYELACRMISQVGTKHFYPLSREIYGDAYSRFVDGKTSNLDLAQHLVRTLSIYRPAALGAEDEAVLTAEAIRPELEARFAKELPGEGITVELATDIASKAIAGPDKVRLRKDARYSRREIEILVVHEGLVHVATTINGRAQPIIRCLGKGAPRTMRVQEGLAVFAEFISGSIDVERLRRLADRIIAIDMSFKGASFLDLYRYFCSRGDAPEEAFENARRVVRGGLVDGGGPFTKDVVYLDGLTRIHGYLHVAVPRGRIDDVGRLFVGKIDLADIPALRELEQEGLLSAPRHMPLWARDLRFLAAYMSYTNFLKRIDLNALHDVFGGFFGHEDGEAYGIPEYEE